MGQTTDIARTKVVIDTTGAVKELNRLDIEARELKDSMNAAKKEADKLQEALKKQGELKDRMAGLTKEVTLLQKEQAKSVEALSQMTAGTKEYIDESLRLNITEGKIKSLTEQIGRMNTEMTKNSQSVENLREQGRAYEKLKEDLKGVNGKIKEHTSILGVNGLNMRQLKQYQKEFNTELEYTYKGTKRYEELTEALRNVNRAIREQRDQVSGANTLWSRISAEAKAFGMVALTYLGAQELIGQVGNLIGGLADLSDAMADVQKTTGLTAQEVDELNNELKNIDTRTSRKDLLDLASIAGKLGVSGKENVLGFVKAADMLSVALGADFGGNAEEAIKQVGKLVDIFKLKDTIGLEQGLIKVGSVINSLGAASSAAEGYLVEFTKRLGGIAPAADISSTDVLALGATLDQLGITAEVGSTAVGQFLMSIGKDVPKFAKVAGLSVAEFSKMLREDANKALITVLKGLEGSTGSLEAMSKSLSGLGIDGAQATQSIGVLAQNVKLLEEQQALARKEFESGSSILNEFTVKNNNLAAVVEKIQKRLAGMFINSAFMKGLESVLILFEKAIKAEEDFTEGLREQELQLRATQQQFNAEMRVLQAGNLTAAQRNSLIAEMNAKYKDILPQLITEKTTNEELTAIQQKSNEVLMQKIILKAQEADLTEKLNRIVDLERKQEADRMRLIQAEVEAEKAREGSGERAARSLSGIDFKREDALQKIDAIKAAVKAREEEIARIQTSIDTEDKLFKKILERKGLVATEGLNKFTVSEAAKAAAAAKAPKMPGSIAVADSGKPGEPSKLEQDIDRTIEKWKQFQEKVKQAKDQVWASSESDFQAELAEIDRRYETLLNEARTFHDNMKVGDMEYNEAVKTIRETHAAEARAKAKEFYEKLIAENEAKNSKTLQSDLEFWGAEADARRAAMEQEEADRQKRLQDTADMYNTMGGLLSEFSSLISATNSLIATQAETQSEFQKQLALVQIGIDTAVSISKAIAGATAAAAATGPAAPFTLAGYMLSMVTAVVSGYAQAKAMLDKDAPKAPTFYYGGHTGDGPAIGYDQYGKIVGGVHKNEYVVNESLLLGNPWVANQVAIIDALRVGRISEPPAMPGQAPSQDNAMMQALLSRFDRLESAVLSLDKPYRAYFDRDESEAMRRYYEQEDSNRQKSRL